MGGPRVPRGLTGGAQRRTAEEKRQWGLRERSRSRFSGSAWERGSVAGGCFLSFEETGSRSALTSPPSHAATHRALIRPERAAGHDWLQRPGSRSRRATAHVHRLPQYGSGRQAPPPARARTFYSPVRRSAKCLGAGSYEIEKEIQRYRCGLGGEAGLELETVG